jgi:hypothetical protein
MEGTKGPSRVRARALGFFLILSDRAAFAVKLAHFLG